MPTSGRSGEGGRRDQRRQRSDATVSLSRTTTTRTIIDTTTIAESEKNDDGGESGSGSGSSGVLFMAGALSGIAEAIVVQPFDMVKTPTSDNPGTNPGVYRTLLQLHHEGGGGYDCGIEDSYRKLWGWCRNLRPCMGTYGTVRKYLLPSSNMQEQEGKGTTTSSRVLLAIIIRRPSLHPLLRDWRRVYPRRSSSRHLKSSRFDCNRGNMPVVTRVRWTAAENSSPRGARRRSS
jgi:hypothetical protein